MDLSINKIQQAKQKQISFEGVKSTYHKSGTPVFNFVVPPYNPLQEDAYLELAFLIKKEKSNAFIKPDDSSIKVIKFDEQGQIQINKDVIDKKDIPAFAYRYKFVKKDGSKTRYELDGFKTIDTKNGEKLNLINLGDNYGISPKAGTMYHAFVDSNAIYDKDQGVKNKDTKVSNFSRNHFNKLGGSLKGLDALLKTGELDPYTYIITTPDIGVDPTSSHKYWSNNVYQCVDTDDFKDFNFDLYKSGKRYVADIALTSQSMISPLVAHALKWGSDSPFFHMLKLEKGVSFGVLPKMPEKGKEYEYPTLGIKIVNPKKAGYNRNKPTYIQFYDSRMASKKQLNDSTKLIDNYDSMPDDVFDIVGYPGSVHQFYFEVDPEDKRLDIFKHKNFVPIKDIKNVEKFLSFENFKIMGRQKAAGGTYWDGQVDLVKANLSNPENNKASIDGMLNMRKYLLGVPEYWTELIQSDFILKTAQMNDKEKIAVAKNNKLTDEQIEQIMTSSNSIPSRVLDDNKTVEDYIEEFPLQSIKVSPELAAIFSEPQFKEDFLDTYTYEKLDSMINTIIDEVIPQKYKGNDDYRTYVVKSYANEIIEKLYISAFSPDLINADASIDKEDLKDVTLNSMLNYKPISVDDERMQVVRKLQKSINTSAVHLIRKKIANELSTISLDDFRQAEAIVNMGKAGLNWRIDAAKDIGDLDNIRNDVTTLNELWNDDGKFSGISGFWSDFVKSVKKYNPAALTVLEITCLGDFYKWNDVNSMRKFDTEATNEFLAKTADSLDRIAKKAKNEEIDKNGFSAAANVLRTGKITQKDRSDILKIAEKYYGKDEGRGNYIKVSNASDENRTKILSLFGGITSNAGFYDDYYASFYENHVAYAKEQQFMEKAGATTGSNYDKYFNNLSMFAGVNPEKYENIDYKAGNVSFLRSQTDHLMKFSQPHAVIYSHTFVENQDKPRLAHHLPLDTKLFQAGNLSNCSDEQKRLATEITGRNDYLKINSKAVAVAQIMKEQIEKQYAKNPKAEAKLLAALRNLTNGVEKEGDEPDFDKAEKFGSMAYEDSLPIIFEKAGMYDVDAILDLRYGMMKDSMAIQQSLWQVMNAIVGTPTLFNGMEFIQTGNETSSKNVFQANRGEILHGLKNDKRYAPYYNKMQAISSMYKDPQLSAIREGYPISLKIDKQDDLEMWPLLKYDEYGSKVINVITSNRLPKGTEARLGADNNEVHNINSIEIKDENNVAGLPDGTKLRRKVYDEKTKKYVDDNVQYLVKDGKIVSAKGKIKVDDTVLTFYVPNPRLEKHKYTPSYNGAH